MNNNCETITHIAGIAIKISGRTIQRCSVCGAKLCDSLNYDMPLNEDGSVPEFSVFPIDKLVRVTAGNPTSFIVMPDNEQTAKLPEDSCIELA